MNSGRKEQRVLIVDDERTNVTFLMNLLKDDYKIVAALDGEKALAIAASESPPDLILLDVMMPGMDGYEVCRRLKADERTKHIPVIFVTAASEVDDEMRGFDLGAVDFITKPPHPAVVQARVKTQIDLKVKTDMLEALAALDPLMNIHNRRRFDQLLEVEWKRALRSGYPLALIMIDIDYFKPYNDHYGHAVGDACLKRVAAILSSCLHRPSDMIARYGGEEIVVLLPATDADGAGAIAELMRNEVDAAAIAHAHSAVCDHVTVSVGVAATRNGHPHPSAAALLEAADGMLYASKRNGRNRVSSA